MTDIIYVKSPSKTDYYIANKNFMRIISISKDYLYVMAEDEGMAAEGAYKIIKINKKTFEKMKELARDNKRKELTNILKKAYHKNKGILENSFLQIRIEESRYHHNPKLLEQTEQKFIDYFNKNQPILE